MIQLKLIYEPALIVAATVTVCRAHLAIPRSLSAQEKRAAALPVVKGHQRRQFSAPPNRLNPTNPDIFIGLDMFGLRVLLRLLSRDHSVELSTSIHFP